MAVFCDEFAQWPAIEEEREWRKTLARMKLLASLRVVSTKPYSYLLDTASFDISPIVDFEFGNPAALYSTPLSLTRALLSYRSRRKK